MTTTIPLDLPAAWNILGVASGSASVWRRMMARSLSSCACVMNSHFPRFTIATKTRTGSLALTLFARTAAASQFRKADGALFGEEPACVKMDKDDVEELFFNRGDWGRKQVNIRREDSAQFGPAMDFAPKVSVLLR
jgi:hypothetical protein